MAKRGPIEGCSIPNMHEAALQSKQHVKAADASLTWVLLKQPLMRLAQSDSRIDHDVRSRCKGAIFSIDFACFCFPGLFQGLLLQPVDSADANVRPAAGEDRYAQQEPEDAQVPIPIPGEDWNESAKDSEDSSCKHNEDAHKHACHAPLAIAILATKSTAISAAAWLELRLLV